MLVPSQQSSRLKKKKKAYKCSSVEPQNPQLEINQVPAIMLSYAILIENFQCREQKQSFPNEDSTAVLSNR